MHEHTRKIFDRSFTGLSLFSVVLVGAALVVLLAPIVVRGMKAFIFQGTVEHRRVMLEQFGHGDKAEVQADVAAAQTARAQIYELLDGFEAELKQMSFVQRRKYSQPLDELRDGLRILLGPAPTDPERILIREKYGQTRWDRAQLKLQQVMFVEHYDYSDPTQMGKKVLTPRVEDFKGTSLEPLFTALPARLEAMLRPRWTFYWRFLFDESLDAHIFGGIWPEVLGTLYLTLGAILFAVPMGIISAIYFVEYARESWLIGMLRTCVSTLAGVPSIVFGLFGLAFFINTMHVSESKSVLAGSLTLAILILPVVIRASEEALRSVPKTYKEAALSLGSSKWRAVTRVILPAALPGILTGVVISMGRAAGETAPIIFTAAVSVGQPLSLWETLDQPTLALPWGVYNLCSEHQAVDEIRHVQYGMVLTLVALVLLLNGAAIVMRARITKKLTG